MKRIALLDANVLSPIVLGDPDCLAWLLAMAERRVDVRIPVVCYYKVRRGLSWLASDRVSDPARRRLYQDRISRLDEFPKAYRFEPMDAKVVRIASDLRAKARRDGQSTASEGSLDADVLIAATSRRLSRGGRDVVVVTENIKHLGRYVEAIPWRAFR